MSSTMRFLGWIFVVGFSYVATSSAATFNVVDDFSSANPGGVWSYRHDGNVILDGSYPLIPDFSSSSGQFNPQAPYHRAGAFHGVAHCPGGCTLQAITHVVIDADELWLHPGGSSDGSPPELVAVQFTAPEAGTYDIEYSFEDLDGACGDGVDWFVQKGATGLSTGSLRSNATGPLFLPGVALAAGDDINFIVTPKSGHGCDSTALKATVTSSPVDSDGDGVPDTQDACPLDPDNDADEDGVCGDVDNCPVAANPDQTDTDKDGIGDACNAAVDRDGDGWNDSLDNCPTVANVYQFDTDGDGLGDLCDSCPNDPSNDVDGDGVCGDIDNCPLASNPNQTDTDGDLRGDACDADDDADGVVDADDNCPLAFNPGQADYDGDGDGDACDFDIDGDGVVDANDACPLTAADAVVVDAQGCSIEQLAPCDNAWRNHGAYVRAVAHAAEDFLEAGLITEEEKDSIVSQAARSECGSNKRER